MDQDAVIPDEKHADVTSQILLGSLVVVACVSIYLNFFTEHYQYIVEAACDPKAEICYVRNCDEEECPPNALSVYKMFTVPATEFPKCSDNSCLSLCEDDLICIPLPCSPETDSCEGPLSIAE